MSEEGAHPQMLGEFEVDNPDYGWWDDNKGNLYGASFDLADSRIHLFDHRSLTAEVIQRIEEWSRRLQSGKYNQGQEYLFQVMGDGEQCHCCLALPFLEEEWIEVQEDGKTVRGLETFDERGVCNTLSLPPKFYRTVALFDPCGAFRADSDFMPMSLANVNDELGWNFKKIGKLITVKLLQAEDRKRQDDIASS